MTVCEFVKGWSKNENDSCRRSEGANSLVSQKPLKQSFACRVPRNDVP